MIRRIEDTFTTWRTNAGTTRVSALDPSQMANPVVAGNSQYSTGVTILQSIPPLFPPQAEHAKILGFNVNARLAMYVRSPADGQTFGKLGKIIAGLTTLGTPTTRGGLGSSGGAFIPWTNGVVQLPNDMSLVGDLFDPAVDPLPPTFQVNNNGPDIPGGTNQFKPVGLQLSLAQTLASAIETPRAQNLMIGMWMQPMLVSIQASGGGSPTFGLLVMDAAYSIVYDDGE